MKQGVWVTLLDKNEDLGRLLFEELNKYGLEPNGHFWEDDLAQFAWSGAIPDLAREECALWVIAGQSDRFNEPATRKGLALLAIAAQSAHGPSFPILLSPSVSNLEPAQLPTPLRSAEVVQTGLGTKATIRAHAKRPQVEIDYRIAVHPLPGLGLWLEVGPAHDPWNGAMLGCNSADGAKPDAQGFGIAGVIPERSTLKYPMRDMRIELRGQEFLAWGAKNEISPAESYFVRLSATPDSIIFGPFPDEDSADVFSVSLL
ncbi:MAG: hypothetical protein C1943_10885 [Halochromatium sp.]|nr:hypothetical protein [Halochromatium sp.]